jgi:hypothetical protein
MFGRRRLIELERENARLQSNVLHLERWTADHEGRERTLRADLEREHARYLEVQKRADVAQNNFEWARVRLNQVEEERATLIATLIKAPIGALEIQRRLTPDQGEGLPHVPDGLFDDVGDDVAQALGLSADEVTHA